MNIYLCCSKHFYHNIQPVKEKLEQQGHSVILPNSHDRPFREEEMKQISPEAHREWKAARLWEQNAKVQASDALLVLNFEKNGQENYIGGATFLEIFKAFEFGKKIFLYNPIPKSVFTDELKAMSPVVVNGDLLKIR